VHADDPEYSFFNNIRELPPHRLAEVHKRLAESKMRYAGTIQNFVAG